MAEPRAIICYSVPWGAQYRCVSLVEDGSIEARMLQSDFPMTLYRHWVMRDRPDIAHCRARIDNVAWIKTEAELGLELREYV